MLCHSRLIRVAVAGALATAAPLSFAASLTPVTYANPKLVGESAPNVLSPELLETPVVTGSTRVENSTAVADFYGYANDGALVPAPGALPSTNSKVEATKTEPDKNTYLVMKGQKGADPTYNYGTHFLYQGHENGDSGQGYLTRINLDADSEHRVTILATKDVNGASLPTIDGSTWYPWSQRLLFTAEGSGPGGGVWQATINYPSTVQDISGVIGRGGYEGIQADSDGNLWIVEDVGGKSGTVSTHAKQPNSFVFRFIPKDKRDLTAGGKLQVLQVMSKAHSGAIVFHAGAMDADILSQDFKDLHTYGNEFDTKWITIHNTDTDGMTAFSANALAKAAGGTPFKRPENGVFQPGTNFRTFVFSETGDTNLLTEAKDYGGFGGVLVIKQSSPSANIGKLSLLYKGDMEHTGFDNVTFVSRNKVVFVEDAGDTLHSQRNALDSAYLLDMRANYAYSSSQPLRMLAQGRDASATLDSQFSGMSGFQNDGDNEITGIHASDGDPSAFGLLGVKIPTLFRNDWRLFYTQQHGDNVTWEILPARAAMHGEHDEMDEDDR
jgi:hypothetical protein